MVDFSDYRYSVDSYAFHITSPENVASIQKHGILREKNSDSDTATIQRVLNEIGYEDLFPFDWGQVVYCHVDGEYVEEELQDDSQLAPDIVFVVIDLDAIDAPMYLADMAIMSDLIDYWYGDSEVMLHANSPEEAVQLYQESMIRVRSTEHITSDLNNKHNHSELVIDGDIPPAAIVDICD